ncbi:MAG: EAL domain-containing protein [Hyphomicrobiaceae bacterium]
MMRASTSHAQHAGATRRRTVMRRFCNACAIAGVALVLSLLAFAAPAIALDAMSVGDEERVEITRRGLAVEGRGDQLQIDTAAGNDGISRRMSVNATTPGTNPNWIVFALRNTTDKVIERWITVQRYSLIGSGVIWPDLDSRRLSALTPSVGFLPQRIENDRADIFKITIDPGQTITYTAEMASTRLSRIYMWKPLAYEFHVRELRLFNGIMLGITGLLGIFLTAVFAANHKLIFPSAALVTWCVLVYLCVDFGFWHKLLQISAEANAVYRAAAEAAMATSLAIFLHTFLRLGSWHGFARMLSSVWMIAQLALVFIAVLDPRLASTFARLSFAALGGAGAALILFLAIRGQDRALSLIPTWLLFLVWLFGAAMTLTGKLNGDIVVSALVAGLVLITVLIGFTVTQFAFRSVEPHYGAAPSEQQLRSLAVEGAGAAVWEWHARRNEIKIGAIAEMALGLNPGELSTKVKDFIKYMHPADQERFNVLLWSLQNKNGGEIRTDFRMRHADNSYRWFDLEAASVPTSDRRSLRCVGLLRDVTDQKRSQARLMQDAVLDSLTGLPNRELFLDRLKTAVARADSEPDLRPTVLFIDLDKFKSINSSFGLIVGDSLLLTISRRLTRHLRPMDTLARLGGDQFAMLILSVTEPDALARLAESVRRSLRAPIKIAGQDIVLTGAIGIAVHDPDNTNDLDILKDSEIAMYRAKRNGADQIEIFRPEMRDERDDRVAIESDLRHALERRQIKVVYQPIIYLPTEELAGFEALVRWEHPKLGVLNPQEFIPVAEESDLIVKLGSYVLNQAVEQAAEWQKQLPRAKHPLFVSVNVSSRQLFRQDLIQEIRHVIGKSIVSPGVLRLEITESLVMENPERAADMLDLLKIAGAGLSLDDFGTGYSSLAYLERFPFDTIKIDRHLVQSSTGGEGSGPIIVRSIVAMAKELDKKIVAEGVEAADDVGFLRSIGCQYAQGYYYGEPMEERDVTDLLKIVRKSERKLQRRSMFRSPTPRKDKGSSESKPRTPQPVEEIAYNPSSEADFVPERVQPQPGLPSFQPSAPQPHPGNPVHPAVTPAAAQRSGPGPELAPGPAPGTGPAPRPAAFGGQALVPTPVLPQEGHHTVPPTQPHRSPPAHWRTPPNATGAPRPPAETVPPPAGPPPQQLDADRGRPASAAPAENGKGHAIQPPGPVPAPKHPPPTGVEPDRRLPPGHAMSEPSPPNQLPPGQLSPAGGLPPLGAQPSAVTPVISQPVQAVPSAPTRSSPPITSPPPASASAPASPELTATPPKSVPARPAAPPSEASAPDLSKDPTQLPPPPPKPPRAATMPIPGAPSSPPTPPPVQLDAPPPLVVQPVPPSPPSAASPQSPKDSATADVLTLPQTATGAGATLPPSIAASLARLAGVSSTAANDKAPAGHDKPGQENAKKDENAASPPPKLEAGE